MLEILKQYPTPTVANAIELFEIRPRSEGFLPTPFHCLMPAASPVAGYAATCAVSCLTPDSHGKRESFEYWEHLEQQPYPRIAVVRDLDPEPGTGAFFGEVNAAVHLALGCLGAVVDGRVRDLDEMRAAGYQVLYRSAAVSHSYVHVVHCGEPLAIGGVLIRPGDLLQMDQHGVLIVPPETLPRLGEAIREIERRERPVIEYARSGSATRQGLVDVVTRNLRNNPRWSCKQNS